MASEFASIKNPLIIEGLSEAMKCAIYRSRGNPYEGEKSGLRIWFVRHQKGEALFALLSLEFNANILEEGRRARIRKRSVWVWPTDADALDQVSRAAAVPRVTEVLKAVDRIRRGLKHAASFENWLTEGHKGDRKAIKQICAAFRIKVEDSDLVATNRTSRGKVTPERPNLLHPMPSASALYGRGRDIKFLKEKVSPQSPGWGIWLSGMPGVGKTALAIHIASQVSAAEFSAICFLSAQATVFDDSGPRTVEVFALDTWEKIQNQIAEDLGLKSGRLPKGAERISKICEGLQGHRMLLILDNLESLSDFDPVKVISFVELIPLGCKVIITCREDHGNINVTRSLLNLEESAAEQFLDQLAVHKNELQKASDEERLNLIRVTSGNPLLLRWTTGNLGRGSIRSLSEAIEYLKSCPKDNDPLRFIFEKIIDHCSSDELRVLTSLAFLNTPTAWTVISEIADLPEQAARATLASLVNRYVVDASLNLDSVSIAPTATAYLRHHCADLVREMGERAADRSFEIIKRYGYLSGDSKGFGTIRKKWPSIAPTIPVLLSGPNDRLQIACNGLGEYLNQLGLWEDWLYLTTNAEGRALHEGDFRNAIIRASHAGSALFALHNSPQKVLECAIRAEEYMAADSSTNDLAFRIHRMKALAYQRLQDQSQARLSFHECLRCLKPEWLGDRMTESERKLWEARIYNSIGITYEDEASFLEAKAFFQQALDLHTDLGHAEGIASSAGNIAEIEFLSGNMLQAELGARKALSYSEGQSWIEQEAHDCSYLAASLNRQGRRDAEYFSLARRACALYRSINYTDLEGIKLLMEFDEEG